MANLALPSQARAAQRKLWGTDSSAHLQGASEMKSTVDMFGRNPLIKTRPHD